MSHVKINGIIRFLDLKNIHQDTKIIILSALVETTKTDVKDRCLRNGRQRNTFTFVSHSNYFKSVTQGTLSYNCKGDMAQSVISQRS